MPTQPGRVLIVQSCRLPQFFFVVDKLRRQFPDWKLDALLSRQPETDQLLRCFPYFNRVFNFQPSVRPQIPAYDRIILPLVSRGHTRIKLAATRIEGRLLRSDLHGNLTPSSIAAVAASVVHVPRIRSADFTRFYGRFPHPPPGEVTLLLETCHPDVITRTERLWRPQASQSGRLIRCRAEGFWKIRRTIRKNRCDSAIVFFTGQPIWGGLKALPLLTGLRRILVVTADGYGYTSPKSLPRFLAQWRQLRPLNLIRHSLQPEKWSAEGDDDSASEVLLLQTDSPRLTLQAGKRLLAGGIVKQHRTALFCNRDRLESFAGQPGISRIHSYRKRRLGHNLRLLISLLLRRHDVVAAIFSGRPVFRLQKLLFFLLPARHRLLFNENLDCYYLKGNRLSQFLQLPKRQRRPFSIWLWQILGGRVTSEVLLLQTESPRLTLQAGKRLLAGGIVKQNRTALFCNRDRLKSFAGQPGISRIHSYRKRRLGRNLRLLISLLIRRHDAVAAIFSGRPVFRLQKLLFFLLPARHRLVFNENLDCYYLKGNRLSQFFQLPKRQRRPFSIWLWQILGRRVTSEVLLLQTESPRLTLQAGKRLLAGGIVKQNRTALFCNRHQLESFAGQPGISRIHSYRKRRLGHNLRLLISLLLRRHDVVAAIFSGRPVFRLQKLLFFLLPARHRLLFNENLDCCYLKGNRLSQFFQLPKRQRRPFSIWLWQILGRRVTSEVLLLQTESPRLTLQAGKRLLAGGIVKQNRTTLFCNRHQLESFAGQPGISRIHSYRKRRLGHNLRLLISLLLRRHDVVAAIFSGRPVFRLQKLLFFLLPARHRLVFNENLDCYYLEGNRLSQFFQLPKRQRRPFSIWLWQILGRRVTSEVLLLQTESPRLTLQAGERLLAGGIVKQNRTTLFCNRHQLESFAGQPGISRIHSYRKRRLGRNLRLLIDLLIQRHDVVAAIFSGRPVFRLQKLLFFLLPARHRLVFNENLDCYYLEGNRLSQFFQLPKRQRRPFSIWLWQILGRRVTSEVLLLQTESPRLTLQAGKRLLAGGIVKQTRTALFCNRHQLESFAGQPGISRIHSYRKRRLGRNLRLLIDLLIQRHDVVAAIFSERPVFRLQKLLFFLLPARHRLVFNENLDCYYLEGNRLSQFFQLPKRQRRPFSIWLWQILGRRVTSEVLLLQTESPRLTLQAGKRLLAGGIVKQNRTTLFCNRHQLESFAGQPGISRIHSYRKRRLGRNLRLLISLLLRRHDVVAAIFSGRPVFRLQKLLFFLLPARHRLVFNENLDCYYLEGNRLSQFFQLSKRQRRQEPLVIWESLRPLLKMFLWLPRFLFLSAWLNWIKLKRARRLSE